MIDPATDPICYCEECSTRWQGFASSDNIGVFTTLTVLCSRTSFGPTHSSRHQTKSNTRLSTLFINPEAEASDPKRNWLVPVSKGESTQHNDDKKTGDSPESRLHSSHSRQ